MTKHFDAIVIGAGQAGPSLAGRLAGAGMSVAVVERHLFGGTCVNTGCTPTKTLIASAQTAHRARRAADFGILLGGDIAIDMARVMARKRSVVEASRTGIEDWLLNMQRCTTYRGHARFESARQLRIGDAVITADKIFINVGGRARVPDLPGIDRVPYMTNASLLDRPMLPRHLVVIGGSYIGLEFAQMFRRFGSEVTVVEKGAHLAGREDVDISEAIRGILIDEGIAVRTSADCIRLTVRDSAAPGAPAHAQDLVVHVDCAAGAPEVVASDVLLAVGRRPNTDDLGLDKAGIAQDERGFILVDEELQTNVEGVWALGDCNGRGAFTHTAYNDFEIVAANLLDGAGRRVSDRIPCYGLFLDPPLGRVGLTEAAARAAGHHIKVGTRLMTRVGRAVEKGETKGLMKLVVDADTGRILGAAILGVGGDEAVQTVLATMSAGVSYTTLKNTVLIHPTVSELIATVLAELV